MAAAPLGLPSARTDTLARRVRLLVTATITYNLIEAGVALTAGAAASSTALIGFGLDSLIEVSSAAAVAWQFSAADHDTGKPANAPPCASSPSRSSRSPRTSRSTPAAPCSATRRPALHRRDRPWPRSPWPSCRCCPYAQRRAGRELGSASAVADSKQTLLCTYLSGGAAGRPGRQRLLGWSWADPIAALVIAAVAVKEGREAWRGDSCCPPAPKAAPPSDDTACSCGPDCTC